MKSSMIAIIFIGLLPYVMTCPDQCECSIDEVKCVDRNLSNADLEYVIRKLPFNITKLDFSQNQITSFSMETLLNFTRLDTLILRSNRLSNLPKDVNSNVPSLRHLVLKTNNIMNMGAELKSYENIISLDVLLMVVVSENCFSDNINKAHNSVIFHPARVH